MTDKEERPGFTAFFSSQEVEFGPASWEAWSDYLSKLAVGEEDVGARAMALACCVSHGVNESTGEHSLAEAFDMEPAAARDIAEEIEAISGGECPVQVDEKARTVSLFKMTFRAPRAKEWGTYLANLKASNFKGGVASKQLLSELCDQPEVFEAYIRQFPAALGSIVVPLSKMAGRGIKIQRKKA